MDRKIRNTILWMILVTTVGLIGVWQIKVAISRDFQARNPTAYPPLKTRHAVRPPTEGFSGDIVEDYIARCINGVTDEEIRWILTDFRNTGLVFVDFTDNTTDDKLLAYRVAQQRWYYGALKDGLRLTPAQAAEAASKLDEILLSVTSEFLRDKNEVVSSQRFDFPSTRFEIILSHMWLFLAYDGESSSEFRFMPWDLCTLTPDQSEITRIRAFSQINNTSGPQIPQSSAPIMEKKFQSSKPFTDDIELPERFAMADALFPYLKSQKFVVTEDANPEPSAAFLGNIRRLHPAQLKLLLLFSPELAVEIQSALDQSED